MRNPRIHMVTMGAASRGSLSCSLWLALFWCVGAWADDPPPEQNLTQREYNRITEMRQEDPTAPPVAAPAMAHNLTDAEKAFLEEHHSVRVLKGKEWKRLSPEERDQRMRALRDQMPGIGLILTVPGGELWAVPHGEDDATFHDILERHRVRLWTEEEKTAMPVAIGNRPTSGDRAGRGDHNGVSIDLATSSSSDAP